MRTSADNSCLDNHKVVVVFDTGRASEMIDLLYSAGATICNLGFADCSQVAEITKIMRKDKNLPS